MLFNSFFFLRKYDGRLRNRDFVRQNANDFILHFYTKFLLHFTIFKIFWSLYFKILRLRDLFLFVFIRKIVMLT